MTTPRRGRAASLLLLLGLALPAAAQSAPPAPERLVEHEVMTWNVGTLNPRDVRLPTRFEDDVVAVIADEAPAVVALQELQGEAQIRRLTAALRARGLSYHATLEASDPRREDGRSMALLHLAPARGSVTFRSSVGEGFRARAVLLPGLTVVGVHAPTGLEHRAAFFPQLATWAATLPKPVVLAGDFNVGPRRGAGPTYVLPWSWRRERRLYQSLVSTFPVRTTVRSTTFYGEPYDHVLTDAGVIRSQRVLVGRRTFPQDHDPLVVTLALPAPPSPVQAPPPEQTTQAETLVPGIVDTLAR